MTERARVAAGVASRSWPRAAGLAVLLSTGLITACGLTAPRFADGHADLGGMGLRDVDRTFSMSIGPALLHFAARHVDDDPELRDLLNQLDGVRIRIYEIDGDADRVASRLDRMARHLGDDGWEPVLLVRQADEQTHLLARFDGGRIRGLTLLNRDGDAEVVVINLMGDIRPERFSDVLVALDVDAPPVTVAPDGPSGSRGG